jgi:AcrR family transcriptional regulator
MLSLTSDREPMTTNPAPRIEQLRQPWFDAAQEILSTEGYGSLKLAAVCKRVGVTTGAFYHSFGSWQEFTDALLENWRSERTTLLIELAQTQGDAVAQLQLLAGVSSDLRHRTEAAIRVWASVDPRVGEVQRSVDDDRYNVVLAAMAELVGPEHAEHFAIWGLSTLVGFEQLSDRYPSEALLWSLEKILAAAIQQRDAN